MLEVLREWGLSQDLAKKWSTLHVSKFACQLKQLAQRRVFVSCLSLIRIVMLCRSSTRNFGGNVFLCHQAIDKLWEQFRMGKGASSTPSASKATMA